MVTNINLSAPSGEKAPALTGKSTLIFLIFLLVAVVSVYGFFAMLKSKYTKEEEQTSNIIKQKRRDLSSADYVEIADFQGRLNMLNEIITNRFPWHSFILEFSKYILPEVKLASFAPGEDVLPINGTAPNYEAVIRQVDLLKKFSGTKSVELKTVSEAMAEEGQQKSVSFQAELKLDKKNFMKNNSSNEETNGQ